MDVFTKFTVCFGFIYLNFSQFLYKLYTLLKKVDFVYSSIRK